MLVDNYKIAWAKQITGYKCWNFNINQDYKICKGQTGGKANGNRTGNLARQTEKMLKFQWLRLCLFMPHGKGFGQSNWQSKRQQTRSIKKYL
jgi:hypothetical protein